MLTVYSLTYDSADITCAYNFCRSEAVETLDHETLSYCPCIELVNASPYARELRKSGDISDANNYRDRAWHRLPSPTIDHTQCGDHSQGHRKGQ